MSGRIFYPSVFNPPGAFTTIAPVAAPRGGETFYPHATRRRVPQRASGELFLPPGNFTRTPPPGPAGLAGPTYPLVERHPDPQTDPARLRRITEKLSAVMNSLAGKGFIRLDGVSSWTLLPGGFYQNHAPGPNDDVTAGAYPFMLWIDTSTNTVYVNVSNTQGTAVWKVISL